MWNGQQVQLHLLYFVTYLQKVYSTLKNITEFRLDEVGSTIKPKLYFTNGEYLIITLLSELETKCSLKEQIWSKYFQILLNWIQILPLEDF